MIKIKIICTPLAVFVKSGISKKDSKPYSVGEITFAQEDDSTFTCTTFDEKVITACKKGKGQKVEFEFSLVPDMLVQGKYSLRIS